LTKAKRGAVVKVFDCVQDEVVGFVNPCCWHQGLKLKQAVAVWTNEYGRSPNASHTTLKRITRCT